MRVVFVYRQSRSGAHSIETVFRAVSAALKDSGVEVIEYVLKTRRHLFADMIELRRLQADIYHVTGDVNFLVAMLPHAKTVLTVHDIGHYLYGLTGWRKIVYRWFWLALPMRLAFVVTVPSTATAEAVRLHLGEIAVKARLVELCYSPSFVPIPKDFDGVCPKILQVGTGHNKNALRIVAALEGVECELIIVGRVTPELQRALQLRRVRYQSHIDVSQAEMVRLYAAADVVAFVSLSEGFGMPIIEAQVMGKALITSNRPPMSEVAGAHACLVDPEDVPAIRAGILRLIEDEDYRRGVIQNGLRNVERFSPPSAAARFRRVYVDVHEHA